jgi:hypothetical protein
MAGGIVLAWPYQLLIRVIPIIQLSFLIVAGFGGALAYAGWWAVQKGHCRNRLVAGVLALGLAGVPLAASYYWEAKHIEEKVGEPMTIADALALKREAGWKIGHSGSPLNGSAVYAIWGGEALIVAGIVLFGVMIGAGTPYCEKCGRWCAPRSFYVPGVGRADAEKHLAAGDLAGLAAIDPPPRADTSINLTFTVTACEGCREAVFLTVEEKKVTVKKNKTNEAKKTIVKDAILPAGVREAALDRVGSLVGQKLPG